MRKLINLFGLELKNLRLHLWIPPLVGYVLIPCLMISETIINGGTENAERAIRMCVQQYVSTLGCWWILFTLRVFIDEEGNEVLHMPSFRWNTLFMRVIGCSLLYLMMILPLFLAASCWWPRFLSFYFGIAIQSVWFAAVAYLLALLTKNTLIPLITITILAIFSFIFPSLEISPIDNTGLYFPFALTRLSILLVSAIIMLITGRLIEKKTVNRQ